MPGISGKRLARGRVRARTLIIAMTLASSLATMAAAGPAQAAAPKGILAVFSDCPTSISSVELCTYAQISSGEFKLGSTTVPINKTVTLQGGAVAAPLSGEFYLVPAKDGNSLSKTELNVPGGLTDLVNCTEIKGNGLLEVLERESCKGFFENSLTGVTATTELVANEHNPAILNLNAVYSESGTGLVLPIRVHLSNPLLGSSCYIGSESKPIELHLTDGTTSPPAPNKPISGKAGEFEEQEEGEYVVPVLRNSTLVDNAFSAPAAEGCGGIFSFLIDPILDAKIGLPSAAGHNTAILTGVTRIVAASEVRRDEK
jgi:hypothetical protein